MRLKVLSSILAILTLILVYVTFKREKDHEEDLKYYAGCYEGLANTSDD